MDTPTATAEAPAPKKKTFFRKPLGCLLSLFVGGLLFLVLLVVFAIWFAGSNIPLNFASNVVNQKSGGELKFAENDTNFFAGRIHYKGIELTNPSRFTDKGFVKINELKAVLDVPSALSDTIVIPELVLDLGSISIVGGEDWIKDNNAVDFKNAFAPAPAAPEPTKPEEPKDGGIKIEIPDKIELPKPGDSKPAETPAPAEPAKKKHFRIEKLVLRMDRLRALSHATTPGETPNVIVDDSIGLNWEFTDVTDENIKDKVYDVVKRDIAKLGGKFAKFATALAVAEIGKYTEQAGKLAAEYTNLAAQKAAELANKAGELTSKATGAATEAVDKGLKSVTSGLGGLLGGTKKEESK